MKFASLLLAAFALFFIQGTAHAQVPTVQGAADAVRGALGDLSVGVDRKIGRDGARIQESIQRARVNLVKVRDLAERGAPKDYLADPVQRARESATDAMNLARGIRSDSVRQFADAVDVRLTRLLSLYASYGNRHGGYDHDDHRGGTIYVPVPVRR